MRHWQRWCMKLPGQCLGALGQQGGKVLRSIGLARATLHLHWKVACYNLCRLCTLKTSGVMAF
ncbi:hypothetical protein QU481_18365 [Crenobacter sp. SG2303]|uniref:Transposase DDE domain-containing protein n=1 Tax=Crenobacter oryzisoli TaxID=3056844 RepID=A0ABT7XSP0_9NEIS|nr:hypothetical protein [Crenobacter sp. SG2303]